MRDKLVYISVWIMLSVLQTGNIVCAEKTPKQSLMEYHPFERACILIRHFESLHKPEHWPTIGYGHMVREGESFECRQYSSIEAERIMRRDLRWFCRHYREFGRDSLVLALLAYNVGQVAVDTSAVVRKLRVGERDIKRDYISFCHYKGRVHAGLIRRRLVELQLFYE